MHVFSRIANFGTFGRYLLFGGTFLVIVGLQSCKQSPIPASDTVNKVDEQQPVSIGKTNPTSTTSTIVSKPHAVIGKTYRNVTTKPLVKRERGEENKRDGMGKAMEFEFLKTHDPALNYIPTERLAIAAEKTDEIMRNFRSKFRTNALPWTERGPNNVAGRTRAILIDKNDATGNTVFAGSVGGGIWKASNFTTSAYSWAKVNDNMTNLAITALVQHPVTPMIMYAGTGEGFFNSDAIRGGGIFKSTDGGTTWAALSSTIPGPGNFDFDYVQDVVVTTEGILYAATRGKDCSYGGIFKSVNGGINWVQVIGSYNNSGSCSDAIDMNGADLEIAANGDLYATTGLATASGINNYGKIWRSSASLGGLQGEFGQWTNITPVPPSPDPGFQRIEIACAPSDAQFVYALCQQYNDDGVRRLYKSIDGGTSWTVIIPPSWCDQGSTRTDFSRGQAWYDLIAAIDPNTSNNIYIGAVDVLKSTNGGSTFAQLTQWASGCGSLPKIHADNHNIVFMPGSSTNIIMTNDGGIFYTTNGGTTFSNRNIGYNVTQYYAVAIHPTSTNYFLAGAQDNGTQKFTSAGVNSTTDFSGGDGAFCHISQKNPLIQISSYVYSNFYISRNGGNSISQSTNSNAGRFINPTSYDENAGILYRGSSGGILGRVTNVVSGTATLTSVTLPALGTRLVSAVLADPNESNTVWVAASGGVPLGAPVVLKVTNAQTATPTVVNVSIPSALPGWYISCIDVERGNSDHLLVTFSNYGVNTVWESLNGGSSWTSIQGNLPDMPVRWGMFLPSGSSEGIIALATELGVYTTSVTSGTFTSWITNNAGFPRVRTDMIKYRNGDKTIIAATHGRGLFTASLSVLPVIWTGAISNDWGTAGNWSVERVPNGYDNVVIPALSPNMPVMVNGNRSVNSLELEFGASINTIGKLQVLKQ